jgi:hypothetical protein
VDGVALAPCGSRSGRACLGKRLALFYFVLANACICIGYSQVVRVTCDFSTRACTPHRKRWQVRCHAPYCIHLFFGVLRVLPKPRCLGYRTSPTRQVDAGHAVAIYGLDGDHNMAD